MPRILMIALLCLQALPLSAAPSGALESLEGLAQTLRAHAVWQARYSQEYVPAGMEIGEEVSGHLWLSWPDRLLFVQEEPEERSMGFEGRKLRLVDPGAGSCDEHMMTEEEWERIPLVAILETQKAVQHFSILEEKGVITLVPRERGGVERVELKLDARGLPDELLILDPQGAASRFSFSDWKAVQELPAGRWLPDPPEGVVCIGDSSTGPLQ